MSTYKLLYAGEVLEGQHPAVVRKRLATLLKLDDARMDVLFSGKAVVVKKTADDALKTRYLAAFEKAGARLQVQPLEDSAPIEDAQSQATSPEPVPEQNSPTAAPGGPPHGENLEALPVGTDILTADERVSFEPADIATDHLKVQGAVFVVDEEAPSVPAPNVDHLSLADVGVQLGPNEQGEGQGKEQAEDALILDVDFDLAEVGADIGTVDDTPPPAAPDTSHIALQEPGS